MKAKTYDFRKFMRNEHKKEVKPPTMSLIPVATAPLWSGVVVSAESATEASIQTKMMSAFDPLLQLIQGIAYPVALSVILAGGLFVIIGNKEKGFDMISKSAMGYMLITVLPMIFDVLVSAMKGVV